MTMAERVARVFYPNAWDGDKPHLREWSLSIARAAIEAMREPTEAMLACELRFMGEKLGYSEIWRRMIDAALAPESAR